MVHWTLDDKEADFLLALVAARPLGEVLALYSKLIGQAQADKQNPRTADAAGGLDGPVGAVNGSGAPLPQ